MTSRRHFIHILPFVAASLAACSKTEPTATPGAAPTPAAPVVAPPAPAETASATAPAPAPAPAAGASTASLIDEGDPVARSLGYVAEAERADKAKYKQWVAGRNCGNCQLFAGKPGDAQALCPLMGGRLVSAKGWCSAHVPKAS